MARLQMIQFVTFALVRYDVGMIYTLECEYPTAECQMVEDLCKVILSGKTTKFIELCYVMNLPILNTTTDSKDEHPSDEALKKTKRYAYVEG